MPLSRDEFKRRMSEALTFLDGLLQHPEQIDSLPAVVYIPSISMPPEISVSADSVPANANRVVSQNASIEIFNGNFIWGPNFSGITGNFFFGKETLTGLDPTEAKGHTEDLKWVITETPRIYRSPVLQGTD